MREFDIAYEAIRRTNHKAVFVSDLLPEWIHPTKNIRVIRERIELRHYLNLMSRAMMSVVPLKVSDHSHGHSDVVRSLQFGRPAVVTASGSCDDYINCGENGVLVDCSVEGITKGISQVQVNYGRMANAAERSAMRHRPEAYMASLFGLIENAHAGQPVGQN